MERPMTQPNGPIGEASKEELRAMRATMTQPTCETCRWWDRFDLRSMQDVGYCRIGPPNNYTSLVEAVKQRDGLWPMVNADDWCGEHRPKEET